MELCYLILGENSFWMMSYAYMELAEETAIPEDKAYAVVQYYLGNIGYNLLRRMDAKDEPSLEMREKTIEHLITKRDCIEVNRFGVNYLNEENMESEIQRLLESDLLNPVENK